MHNEFTNNERAEVLTQAIPYIQRYNGQIVVIKYGGNAMSSEELKEQVMEDIVLLQLIGIKVVLVHGGGPEISELMAKLGKKAEFVDGLRVTNKETVDIAQMVLAGKINKSLVNYLGKLGYVGEIVNVNIDAVLDLLEKGYIPVISTLGCDKDGNTYNINGDTAAARIAGALGAKRLIMMTDIAGILKDKDDPNTLIPHVTIKEAKELFNQGVVSGGMIPKVECCIDAISHGVKKVIIMDGRVPHSILMELLTDEGAGTMVMGDE